MGEDSVAGSHRQLRIENERLARENALLYDQLGPLLALQEFVDTLVRPEPAPTLAPIVVRSALSVLAGQTAALAVGEAAGTLTFTAAEGVDAAALRDQPYPGRQGVLPWVFERQRPLVVGSADRRLSPFERTFCPTGALAAAPLGVGDRRLGVLVVFGARAGDHAARWLASAAATLAAAFEIDQLRHDLQRERQRILVGQAEVRRKIARDLHDGPAQQLAALVMDLELTARLLTEQPARATAELRSAIDLAHRTMADLRTMLFELRPLILESQGLAAALAAYLAQVRADTPTFHLAVGASVGRCSPDAEAALFAVAQEAIVNVRKHARARNCWVRLTRRGKHIWLTVRDDGQGFDVTAVQRTYAQLGSLGLISMRERIELVGGTFTIESAPGQGTTVTARVPVARSTSSDARGADDHVVAPNAQTQPA